VTTDMLPAVVRSYFEAVDAQDAASVARCFASNALVATPSPGAESDERITRLPAQLQRDLAERGPVPWRHRLRGVRGTATASIIEGELVDRRSDDVLSRFVVVIRTDNAGKIETFRGFRQGDRATHLASPAECEAWLAVLRAAAGGRGKPAWLADGLAPGARMSLPEAPLPSSGRPSAVVCAGDSESMAVYGRIGKAAEYCVIARGAAGEGVSAMDAYWCRLSAREVAWKQGGNT
jgi:hypothetical protein